jgi:N-acetylmuramic acid 6-phosphate etherase
MVDVQATNAKLAVRRERIVMHLTGKGESEVRDALQRTGGNVKLAVLLLQGCDLRAARDALECAGGRLREAIALARPPRQA